MNNELGRKITSLTLMTIMLAGGMTIAAPGIMPAAHAANEMLFVSAESSIFANTFGGPQVLEVIVTNPDIIRVDEIHGAPIVKVNGQDVLMSQTSNGSWYAYIADADMLAVADGNGFQFDTLFTQAQSTSQIGKLLTDTQGFYAPDVLASALKDGTDTIQEAADFDGIVTGGSASWSTGIVSFRGVDSGATAFATFTDGDNGAGLTVVGELTKFTDAVGTAIDDEVVIISQATNVLGNVIESPTPLNQVASGNLGGGGQDDSGGNGLYGASWPFVQLYDFNQTGTVEIVYNKAGVDESVTLTFDTTAGVVTFGTDRSNVPIGAEIHYTLGDPQLNIDPTSEDQWFFDSADGTGYYRATTAANGAFTPANLMFDGNGALSLTTNSVIEIDLLTVDSASRTGITQSAADQVQLFETGSNTSVFTSFDDSDDSTLQVSSTALRGTAGVISYNGLPFSILASNFFGELILDESVVGDEWNSGESINVILRDEDANLNTRSDENLTLSSSAVTLVPSLQIGSPLSMTGTTSEVLLAGVVAGNTSYTVDSFSKIARVVTTAASTTDTTTLVSIDTGITVTAFEALQDGDENRLNVDIRSICGTTVITDTDFVITDDTGTSILATQDTADDDCQFIFDIDAASNTAGIDAETVNVNITLTHASASIAPAGTYPIVVDFFRFGDRANDAIYRFELEENGDNTGEFIGLLDYSMINQLNQAAIISTIVPISDEVIIYVTEDLTDEDSPRVNYLDLGADGVSTQIADQQAAPSHSGTVDLDMDTYKKFDTVNVTLTDLDLNVDSFLIDVFTTPAGEYGHIGTAAVNMLNITFNDSAWTRDGSSPQNNSLADGDAVDCTDIEIPDADHDINLRDAGFTLVETDAISGIFTGSFQIPAVYCQSGESATTTGTDIEVNYNDHRDASGETIEVGDGAGVRANTGSISLDRTVYPVPWGLASNFDSITSGKTPNNYSIFPVHATGITAPIEQGDTAEQINGATAGNVIIHVRVSDPDLDTAAAGQDTMNTDTAASVASATIDPHGPVKITVSRGNDEITLAYAGGATVSTTKGIVDGTDALGFARTLGPILEVDGATGVFEIDVPILYTDGPQSTLCPNTSTSGYTGLDVSGSLISDRFKTGADADTGAAATTTSHDFCILQGDILTVEYTDATDASGNVNTVTDSATFDLRNGVLQSDKSVYIIGSDMIVTIIEPDWDLDNDGAQTYDRDVLEWDSDAATTTVGDLAIAGVTADTDFDPEPSAFRETGDSTGIFQIVLEIPASLNSDNLERGEEIKLEYTDWGPSGARYVGQEKEDMNVTVFTSNFGATVELDQKVYTWTDKVYITIVAPDHNFDSNLVDTIGETADDPIKITTRQFDINQYSLVETGTDTGIFTGEVILTGFLHDSNGDGTQTGPPQTTSADSTGPTNGFIESDEDDGLTVSFEFSEDETVVGSALIRWNIGEVQWLEASYPASGTGVVRVIDPDMNLNPEAVDNFGSDIWSDSDAGGIRLTVTETNEATGIFEGTVFFTTTNESSGHRLRVSEGDTVTAEYEDNTLPDPYTRADELDVTATTLIGTIVPPLERAPAANLRTVDAFGNSLDAVSVDQQVQISADLANGQDREQAFAYLVQIQDGNGVTVSLAWITGSLSSGQSFSPALSWIPTDAGTYTATAFVWESVDNPTALSPPVSTTVNVN